MTDPHALARAYLTQLARVYVDKYASRRRLTWREQAGSFVLTVSTEYTATAAPTSVEEVEREIERLAGLPDGETA